jgi:hypothetical protein
LTLHDSPYFEAPTDIEGFVEMYHYPPQTVASYPAAGLGQS